MGVIVICPFCGCELKKGNNHHCCDNKKSFLENLDLNELKTKYVDEEYSILDLGIYINKKYDSILFSKIPDSFIRTLIKKYFPDDYRDVKSSTNTKKIKQKYENTMLEHFGCKHNFQKECSSRKEWEKRLFEEEGITNVFQRESVKEKALQTLLKKYNSIEEIKKMRGFGSTKEGFQKKYGDEWEDKWNDFIQSKQTMSPEFYKNKYGNDWEKYWEIHLKKLQNRHCSNYTGLNEKCYDILNKYHIQFEKEYPILKNKTFDTYGKGYYNFYDIKINNLLIELNGTYWHCDPRKYKANDIVKFPNNTFKRVQDVWDKDLQKIQLAKDNGFLIETIWEDDFSEEKVIDILKKYNLWKL